MTLPLFDETLGAMWKKTPSLRSMLAGFFGIKPQEEEKPGDLGDLLVMFPQVPLDKATQS